MANVPYMISGDGNITLILFGEQYFINVEDSQHARVMDALRDNATEDELLTLVDKTTAIKDYTSESGLIEIKDGCVIYDGEEVHNSLTERILTFMGEGLPVEPLLNFMEKMMQNPSFGARRELFDFLEHKNLPLTEDGDFLAYKAVKHDYSDKWSGSYDNSIGTVAQMKRFSVDDDRNHSCSAGLHAGTLEYVQSYGCFHDSPESDKVIIVKISPENVVSVPTDCNCQKLRTCEYTVVRDYEGVMEYNLYTDDGEEWRWEEEDDDAYYAHDPDPQWN
tara:strand:- start:60 stop:890 length:831 start_codon:yes stop_codon:yes gene_type:complete